MIPLCSTKQWKSGAERTETLETKERLMLELLILAGVVWFAALKPESKNTSTKTSTGHSSGYDPVRKVHWKRTDRIEYHDD